jgi:predicted Zn-dependent peptidase
MESDRMHNISLNARKIDVQRKVVMEEFKQGNLNRPYGDVSFLLRAMAFKKHPYRWSTIGRKLSHIADVPAAVIRKFYKSYYAPDNAVLAVVGDISFEQVVEWSEKWFGHLPAKGFEHPALPVEPRQNRIRRKRVVRAVPENALYMVFHMGGRLDTDYYPCDVISDILSNGYSGRFMARLVKGKKLFSRIDAFISGCEDPGMFWIYTRVPDGVVMEEAEAAIWNELELLKNEPVPDEELEKVRNRFESEYVFRNVSGETLCNNIALAELRGSLDSHLLEPRMYRDVTKEGVMSAARELFRKGNSVVLRYMKKLRWAEQIVMIFPTWWMTMPAMVKGFIDKVIFPGIVYKMEGSKLVSKLSNLKQVVIITTMNTPADIYKDVFGNSIEGSLIKGTFNQIGIHDIRWISLNMVKQVGDEKRWVWLDEIENEFAVG